MAERRPLVRREYRCRMVFRVALGPRRPARAARTRPKPPRIRPVVPSSPTASRRPLRARPAGVRFHPPRPRYAGGPPLRPGGRSPPDALPALRTSPCSPTSAPRPARPSTRGSSDPCPAAPCTRPQAAPTGPTAGPARAATSTSRSVRPRPNPYSRSMRPPPFTTRCRYACKMSCGPASGVVAEAPQPVPGVLPEERAERRQQPLVMSSRPSPSTYHAACTSQGCFAG